MTEIAGRGIDTADVRRLLTEARAVVADAERLPEEATSADATRWAQLRADTAREQWRQLTETVRTAHAERLSNNLRAIIGDYVPFSEAPPELLGAAEGTLGLINVLAGDFRATIPPLAGGAPALPPDVIAAIRAILVELAPEFG